MSRATTEREGDALPKAVVVRLHLKGREFEPLPAGRLPPRVDRVVVLVEARVRPLVEDEDALPVQPVGRPVGAA